MDTVSYTGMKQAAYPYRFNVIFDDEDNTDYAVLTREMVSIQTKTSNAKSLHDMGLTSTPACEATLYIRAVDDKEEYKLLNKMLSNRFNLTVNTLDGVHAEPISPIEKLMGCVITKMEIARSYESVANRNKVVHIKVQITSDEYEIQ